MGTNNSLRQHTVEEEEVLNLKELIRKIFSKWYLFGIFGFIGLVGAYAVNKILQPSYEIQTTLIAKNSQETFGIANMFQNVGIRPQSNKIQNHIGVLGAFSITRQAIENLDWRITWYENSVLTRKDLYKYPPLEIGEFNPLLNLPGVLLNITPLDNDHCMISVNEKLRISGVEKIIEFEEKYKYGEVFEKENFNFTLNKSVGRAIDPEKQYSFTFNDLNRLAKNYMQRLEVSLIDQDADLIRIRIEGNQPEREADFLNELCNVFIDYGLRKKNEQFENTVKFIDAQLTGIVDSLQSAGRSFTNFRSQNRIVDISQEANIVVERLEELQTEESLAKMRLEYYQNLLSYLGDADKMEQVIAPSVVGITDPALNQMVVSLGELYSRRTSLSFSAQEKNPSLLALENDIIYMQQSLEENLKNLIDNAELQLNSIQQRKSQINSQLARLPKTEQDLVNIKRQFDLNNDLYTYLLRERAEAAITTASNVPDISVLDPARLETAKQLGPNTMLNFLIGLVLGMGIPFIYIVFLHYFDQTIKTKEDIEKETSIPVLSVIGHHKKSDYLPVINSPHSGISEAFRIIRTNLAYLASKANHKVIAIHSTAPGEGKTFFAMNLAAIIAQNNKSVLLISGDLRKPKIHNIFNIPNEKGLTSYLINKEKIEDIIVNSKIKNLTIIPSGPTPPNPAELLSNGNLEKLISKAKEYFEYIVIDNAPVGIVTDGMIIGEFADINLFVTRSEYTKVEQIKMIDQFGKQQNYKNISIVVNDVENKRFVYRSYNGKGYGHYAEKKATTKTVKL